MNKWRRSKVVLVVEKITCIIEPKPQRADAERVMHAEQIVRLDKSTSCGRSPGPVRARQSASHEKSSPTIRAGVGEDAEGFTALLRVLPNCEEPQSWIELQVGASAVIERLPVELELEYFASSPTSSTQLAKTKRIGKPIPVGIDRDRAHACGHAVSRVASSPPASSA